MTADNTPKWSGSHVNMARGAQVHRDQDDQTANASGHPTSHTQTHTHTLSHTQTLPPSLPLYFPALQQQCGSVAGGQQAVTQEWN